MAERTEPRYRALLDADRPAWPSERLFQHYRRHYLSEPARGRFILRTLSRYVPEAPVLSGDVLDIGCGDGGVAIAFAAAGARAAGIEPSLASLRRARVRAQDHEVTVTFTAGVAEALPLPDASRDLVILDNVLEHVDDRERTLAEVRRVLRPHGILYLVTPKPFAITSLLADPHYSTPGLVLLPRSWQRRLIERRLGPGAYDVGRIPTRRWVVRALRWHGFVSLAAPRDLWLDYLQDRVSRPEEVRAGIRRRLAAWLAEHGGVFRPSVVRWLADIAMGSNFFIARKAP